MNASELEGTGIEFCDDCGRPYISNHRRCDTDSIAVEDRDDLRHRQQFDTLPRDELVTHTTIKPYNLHSYHWTNCKRPHPEDEMTEVMRGEVDSVHYYPCAYCLVRDERTDIESFDDLK